MAASPPAAALEPPRGLREHDGFYLRLGLGLGRVYAKIHSDASTDFAGRADGSMAGGGLSFEIALGGTLAPGFVLGGALYVIGSGNPRLSDFTVDGQATGYRAKTLSLGLFGPFVDYYIDPKAGWHVQGALGIGSMTADRFVDAAGVEVGHDRRLGGLGFMLGGGCELWTGEQWSMGALLRFMYVSVETDNSAPERWSYHGFAGPEVLFTTTYQ